ncbi:MAG: hypothetical protein R2731_11260 [Nocardioides sp.]
MFGYGAREAVVAALRGRLDDQPVFGPAAPVAELEEALAQVLPGASTRLGPAQLQVAGPRSVATTLAFAFGWSAEPGEGDVVLLRPAARPAP